MSYGVDECVATVDSYQAVVLANQTAPTIGRIGAACREAKVPVIAAEQRGAFGRVLCDFGAEIEVTDPDGEEPAQRMIASVVVGPKTIVTVHEEARHGLSSGDLVTFKGMEGPLASLNGCAPARVLPKDGFIVEVEVDTSGE